MTLPRVHPRWLSQHGIGPWTSDSQLGPG